MTRDEYGVWYREVYLQSPHWHEVQKQVHGRNGGMCERCNTADMAHVHHNHYNSLWHELEDPASVTGVCAECHAYLHGRSTRAPAAVEPDEPEGQDVMCVDCGKPAQVMTRRSEPICMECLRWRKFVG